MHFKNFKKGSQVLIENSSVLGFQYQHLDFSPLDFKKNDFTQPDAWIFFCLNLWNPYPKILQIKILNLRDFKKYLLAISKTGNHIKWQMILESDSKTFDYISHLGVSRFKSLWLFFAATLADSPCRKALHQVCNLSVYTMTNISQ